MSLTDEQIHFINELAERVETAESTLEAAGDLSAKLDGIDALAKNFDFGSEMAQIKEVLGHVVSFLGIELPGAEGGAQPALAAEGGVEKGDQVVSLGEHSDARKKEGTNFAAELMPIPTLKKSGEPTLMDVVVGIAKRLDALEGTSGGRTSGEVTGEPVAKRAQERPLFAGKF